MTEGQHPLQESPLSPRLHPHPLHRRLHRRHVIHLKIYDLSFRPQAIYQNPTNQAQ